MKPFTLPLSDPNAALETVGGKGLSLAKMIGAGFPVPNGFHVTTAAYRAFVDANNLQTKILAALADVDASLPATLEAASATIRGFFAPAPIPTDIASAITTAYAALPHPNPSPAGRGARGEGKPVAVRSSATAEDLPEASFAGQQETFLNIRGEADLLEAVKKCWASLWTARAIAYRAKQNIDPDSVTLAVVVQEMVNAEAAGILFTANPINGRRDEMVINAAWGLGEAIVGGLVSPDTIVAEKATGKVKSYEVAEKTVITVRTEKGTREEKLEDGRTRSKVMKDAEVVELVDIARGIESFYSSPQDIEWCRAESPSPAGRGARGEGKFFIVQSRPVTALPPEPVQWIPPNPKGMYARGSLCEHLPNPVSPLFGTLGLRMVNIPTAEIGEMALGLGGVEYQYRTINGYVYLGMVLAWREWISMAKASSQLTRSMFKVSHEHWQAGRKELIAAVAAADEKNVEALTPLELLDRARELMMAIGKFYTVIQASTLPSASSSEIVFTRAYKFASRKDDPKPESLLLGLETTPLRAEKFLFDLGTWIRERPTLRDFTLRAPTSELVAALQADSTPEAIPAADWSELKTRFTNYLGEFGRASYEFDFMNPTPAETPAVILDALKLYANGKGTDPYARQRDAAGTRERTLNQIRNRFKLLPNRWLDKSLNWALRVAPDREDSIADLGMGHTTLRRFLDELGKRFAVHGALQNADEIYWLVEDEVSELASLLERGETLTDHSARIVARKAEWQEQKKLVPPAMLPETSVWAKMMPWGRKNMTGNVLTGVAGGTGKVTGAARVLFGPEDFGKMKPGDVLVAVTTTPAWTPLFAMASAIVTDIGGPLSHSSIVAREYGIPAVLATGIATRRIADGQTVTVDGSAGTVTLA
ncbi:MAG: PEP/pyruvate-binding domain-containing protein [Chloroflexota bacterium]